MVKEEHSITFFDINGDLLQDWLFLVPFAEPVWQESLGIAEQLWCETFMEGTIFELSRRKL